MKNLELESLGLKVINKNEMLITNGGGKISFWLGYIVGNTIEAVSYVGTLAGEGIERSGFNHAGANK